MNKWLRKSKLCVLLAAMLVMLSGVNVMASEDDNSLSSLGILTEGATVSPDFSYDTWSYTVTVPGGTTELSLDPVPSSGSAVISDISGTTLNEDGTGYVTITVQAGNGSSFTYELNVVSDGTVPAAETETETEKETEKQTEAQTEPETEDPRYVKVDRNSLQEAENTITNLKEEITKYRDKVNLFTMIMYGLIGLSVILLFIVINLLLKKKDLKAELNDYRSYGYSTSKKEQKKAEKKQKKNTSQDAQDMYTYSQPASPAVKPAAMQNGYDMQQGQSGYPGAGADRQSYPGLDVQPQTSKKKGRQMPQYEQPAQYQDMQPQQSVQKPAQQPAAGGTPENPGRKAPAGAPKQGGKKKDVEINMVDL